MTEPSTLARQHSRQVRPTEPANFMPRLVAVSILSLVSCVAPSRSVVHGDAYSFVMERLEVPAATRVFVKGQYSPTELPAAVWIGNVGFASAYSMETTVELARKEGQRLKADYVVVYTSSSGAASVLGMSAFRILPANLGYVQENGLVTEILRPEAAKAGLQVGDRILAIGGVPFSARIRRAFELVPGEVVPVTIQRDGTQKTLQVTALPNPATHLSLLEAQSL